MIWDDPGDKTYADLYFDPFWRAAAERNMPVSLHILTGKNGFGKHRWRVELIVFDFQRSAGSPHLHHGEHREVVGRIAV